MYNAPSIRFAFLGNRLPMKFVSTHFCLSVLIVSRAPFVPAWMILLLVLSTTSPLALAAGPKPHIVMLVAEREYETDRSLREFANSHLANDFRTTFVVADDNDKNLFVGIDAVNDADLLLVSVRRRTPSKDQLDVVRRYVAAGKPVIGIRTASHAFCLRKQAPPQGRAGWPEWDEEVFGGHYSNHHGNLLKATVTLRRDSADAAKLLRGIHAGSFVAGGSLYVVSPLAKSAVVCMDGKVQGKSSEPIAWTFRREGGGKSFYTSLGHVDDFHGEVLPQLLINAISWGLAK